MTHETDTALVSMPPIEVLYRNHRGEVRKRRIIPLDTPYVGTTDWHAELGWLLRAHDVDKNAARTFTCIAMTELEVRDAAAGAVQKAPHVTLDQIKTLIAAKHADDLRSGPCPTATR